MGAVGIQTPHLTTTTAKRRAAQLQALKAIAFNAPGFDPIGMLGSDENLAASV
ncbi:MAG: hypothetical protein LBU32_09530 [Clostridiales bacterium]|jgi:hypothetical protein|nr:hypothetical protein [Clostridiales bacterium]